MPEILNLAGNLDAIALQAAAGKELHDAEGEAQAPRRALRNPPRLGFAPLHGRRPGRRRSMTATLFLVEQCGGTRKRRSHVTPPGVEIARYRFVAGSMEVMSMHPLSAIIG